MPVRGVFRLVLQAGIMKNQRDLWIWCLLLCWRKDQAPVDPSQGSPLSEQFSLIGGLWTRESCVACQREVVEEVNPRSTLEKIEQLMTVSTPERDPWARLVTIAHLVCSPVVPRTRSGWDAKDVVFVDVDFQTGKCYLDGAELASKPSPWPLCHYPLIHQTNPRPSRLELTFLYLLEESSLFTKELN